MRMSPLSDLMQVIYMSVRDTLPFKTYIPPAKEINVYSVVIIIKIHT